MTKDPIVEEVHRIREKIVAKFNYDIRALVRSIQETQKRSGRKFVRLTPKRTFPISPHSS